MTTGNQFLEGELNRALQRHGRGHGNHGPWSNGQRTTHSELECEDGVCISVADSVTSSIKGAHIVDGCACSDEMCRRWSTSRQIARQRSIQ
jgi:hypothetical protein